MASNLAAPAFNRDILNKTDIAKHIETDTKYKGIYAGISKISGLNFNFLLHPKI